MPDRLISDATAYRRIDKVLQEIADRMEAAPERTIRRQMWNDGYLMGMRRARSLFDPKKATLVRRK